MCACISEPNYPCAVRRWKSVPSFPSSLRRTCWCRPTPWSTARRHVSMTPRTSRTTQSNASWINSATSRGRHWPCRNWKRCGGFIFLVALVELNGENCSLSIIIDRKPKCVSPKQTICNATGRLTAHNHNELMCGVEKEQPVTSL